MSLYVRKDSSRIIDKNRSISNKSRAKMNQKMAFKGGFPASALNGTFNLLQTSEVVGPALVDAGAMITPRTFIDYTRGPEAGNETLRRETFSTGNIFMPNIYGMVAGALINLASKNKLPNVAIDGDSMETFKNIWKRSNGNNKEFYKNLLTNITATVGEKTDAKISAKDIDKIAERMAKAESLPRKEWKKEHREITKLLEQSLKASKGLVVTIGDNIAKTDAKGLVNNARQMVKEFFSKNHTENQLDDIIKKACKRNEIKTIAGLGTALGVGFTVQGINRYITKLKTGSDAFVGNPDYENMKESGEEPIKKTLGFKLARIGAAVGMGLLTIATVARSPNPKVILNDFIRKPKNLLKELECKSLWPSVAQLKALYGCTVAGRMAVAADKDELRETVVRDYSGLLNWLVIGEIVGGVTVFALAARKGKGIDLPKVVNGSISEAAKKITDGKLHEIPKKLVDKLLAITKLRTKTHAEIDALDKAGKLATGEAQKAKNITAIGTSTNLIYSGLSLGAFVPWLNKRMTNKTAAKRKDEAKKKSQENFDTNKSVVEKVLGKINVEKVNGKIIEYPEEGSYEDNKRIVETMFGKL